MVEHATIISSAETLKQEGLSVNPVIFSHVLSFSEMLTPKEGSKEIRIYELGSRGLDN